MGAGAWVVGGAAGTPRPAREENVCGVHVKAKRRDARACKADVGYHTVERVGGLCCSRPSSPHNFCRSLGNELSSQIKHEMGTLSPLGHSLWLSYLSTTFCMHSHTRDEEDKGG